MPKPLKQGAGIVAVGLGLLLQGCAVKVAPWERGHLAKPHMAMEPLPNQNALRTHVFDSKEASQGGYGGTGGGCGCN